MKDNIQCRTNGFQEVSSVHQREGERRGSHTALQAQLTRSRAESATLRDQLASLKFRHKVRDVPIPFIRVFPLLFIMNLKWSRIIMCVCIEQEEVDDLRGQLAEAERNNRGLERARRNLATLTSKQQRLIEVLEKQKVSWDKVAVNKSYLSWKLCQPGMKCTDAHIIHMLKPDAIHLKICGCVFIPQLFLLLVSFSFVPNSLSFLNLTSSS